MCDGMVGRKRARSARRMIGKISVPKRMAIPHGRDTVPQRPTDVGFAFSETSPQVRSCQLRTCFGHSGPSAHTSESCTFASTSVCLPTGSWKMGDPYFEAIQKQWPNIRGLYKICESKKPVMLYDIQEHKVYAYPYQEFKAELSKKSQALLERDYKSASTTGSIVVFVRDNIERKLLSYTMSVDTMCIQSMCSQ